MIENPVPTRRARLVWQRPLDTSGRRDSHAVAELVETESGISFNYLDEHELTKARQDGFMGYPGLPMDADDLGPIAIEVLSRRLLPKQRADFGQWLAGFGLSTEDDLSSLTLLAYTGARLTSDSFSVCETFEGFNEPFSYVFDVIGSRHYRDRYGELEVGESLAFVREIDNEQDPNAIVITRSDGTPVGYVNRLQADTVGQWVDAGQITGTVFRVNGRLEYPRLFLLAEISSTADAVAA